MMYKTLQDVVQSYPVLSKFNAGNLEVWYQKTPTFRCSGIDERALDATHVKLGTLNVDLNGTDKEIKSELEHVYMVMQGEYWSPKGEARNLISSLGLSHTSMSVGDVIKYKDNVWGVDSWGFKKLNR